jgi:hypothetical protein
MRLCHNTRCTEMHGHWAGLKEPAKRQLVGPDEIWCSLTCAAADGGYCVRTGFDKTVIDRIRREEEDG